MGDTSIYLAKRAAKVYTIEPSLEIAKKVSFRLKKFNNIELIIRASEDKLESIVSSLRGRVCFFLDGHASGGETFNGSLKAPIEIELSVIGKYIKNFSHISVLVDDVRLFDEVRIDLQEYPTIINWAKGNNLEWFFHHDMFTAKSKEIE